MATLKYDSKTNDFSLDDKLETSGVAFVAYEDVHYFVFTDIPDDVPEYKQIARRVINHLESVNGEKMDNESAYSYFSILFDVFNDWEPEMTLVHNLIDAVSERDSELVVEIAEKMRKLQDLGFLFSFPINAITADFLVGLRNLAN